MADQEEKDPIEHWTAILIAIVTVIAAVVAWRASVAADAAGDEDYDGVKAVINIQEVKSLSTVEAYQHAQAYANYRRYAETSADLEEAMKTAPANRKKELGEQKSEADALVDSKLKMFPNKFMDRKDRYHADSEIGELVANQAKIRDLDPVPHFENAEVQRTKAENLLLGVVFMTLGLVCLTLVETLEGGGRKGMLVLGILLSLGGSLFAFMVEGGKL